MWFASLYKHLMPRTTNALFNTENRDIRAFKTNQGREPIPETLEPIQKTHLLHFVPLELFSVPKSV